MLEGKTLTTNQISLIGQARHCTEDQTYYAGCDGIQGVLMHVLFMCQYSQPIQMHLI